MGQWPYTASENLATDKRYYVLQYYMTNKAYAKQLLDMIDLFGTLANYTVAIYTFIVES